MTRSLGQRGQRRLSRGPLAGPHPVAVVRAGRAFGDTGGAVSVVQELLRTRAAVSLLSRS